MALFANVSLDDTFNIARIALNTILNSIGDGGSPTPSNNKMPLAGVGGYIDIGWLDPSLYVSPSGDTMTGVLLLPDGNDTDPSIAFSSDSTQGMFLKNATTIQITSPTTEVDALVATSTIRSTREAGNAGGALILDHAPASSLPGEYVTIDNHLNSIRIYENGANQKGAFIDLTECGNTSGSKLWHADNDGTGSGLDADLVRGLASATSETADTVTIRTNTGNIKAWGIEVRDSGGSQYSVINSDADVLKFHMDDVNAKGAFIDLSACGNSSSSKIWHDDNDGTGSGLDADLVRGLASSETETGSTVAVREATGVLKSAGFQSATSGGDSSYGVFDANLNRVRMFESANTNRGVYIDITECDASAGSKLWHSGNGGTGSGLDADLLQGAAPTELSTVSTIVKRSATGRINAKEYSLDNGTFYPLCSTVQYHTKAGSSPVINFTRRFTDSVLEITFTGNTNTNVQSPATFSITQGGTPIVSQTYETFTSGVTEDIPVALSGVSVPTINVSTAFSVTNSNGTIEGRLIIKEITNVTLL